VAERLGNTPAVCRKSYVHPVILERYLAGKLAHFTARSPEQRLRAVLGTCQPPRSRIRTAA
jgi:DNA topoisomerase I